MGDNYEVSWSPKVAGVWRFRVRTGNPSSLFFFAWLALKVPWFFAITQPHADFQLVKQWCILYTVLHIAETKSVFVCIVYVFKSEMRHATPMKMVNPWIMIRVLRSLSKVAAQWAPPLHSIRTMVDLLLHFTYTRHKYYYRHMDLIIFTNIIYREMFKNCFEMKITFCTLSY